MTDQFDELVENAETVLLAELRYKNDNAQRAQERWIIKQKQKTERRERWSLFVDKILHPGSEAAGRAYGFIFLTVFFSIFCAIVGFVAQ